MGKIIRTNTTACRAENETACRMDEKSPTNLTTFRSVVRAKRIIAPNANEFVEEFLAAKRAGRVFVLGRGSKVLANDVVFDGTVILTKNLNEISIDKLYIAKNSKDSSTTEERGVILSLGAGVFLPAVADFACKNGYTGLERICGIPASVGGAICLNAESFGCAFSDMLIDVTVCDELGTLKIMQPHECEFGYRTSLFRNSGKFVILSCRIMLECGDAIKILELMKEFQSKRRFAQPVTAATFGSTFWRVKKIPDNTKDISVFEQLNIQGFVPNTVSYTSAGYYIEQCGLKGFCIGGARISNKHANFIENTGDATCKNVIDLVEYIEKEVFDKFGVQLCRDFLVLE